jgi:hypothetical protein
MKLSKNEVENILTMINSEDEDNMYIGFKALEKYTCKDSDIGYLIYLYKYSKKNASVWEEYCKKHYKTLSKMLDMEVPLSYAKGLNLMVSLKIKPEIIEIYLEKHVDQLITMLEHMGYPVDHLNFNLTLRKYE